MGELGTLEDMGSIPGQGTKIPPSPGATKLMVLQLLSPLTTTWKHMHHNESPCMMQRRSDMLQLRPDEAK